MCDKRVCACRKKSDSGVVRKVLEDEVKRLEKDYERFMKTDGSSMLKKYLTPYRFDKLKTLKTFHGSTLRDVIRSGLANPDSNIGIYAPDPEAYDVFSSLYDPVIEEYHRGFAADDVHPDLDWGKPEDIGDLDEERKYINSTRIRCARSIHGYPFNPTMTESQYLEVERKVINALKLLKDDLRVDYYPLSTMKEETKQQLIDDHFLFKEGDRFLNEANATRFWPTGRGIFFNEAKTFLVWCNEEDHMRLISMEMGGNLASVYNRLVKGVQEVEKQIQFSRHERLGFLTFCPTNLGTTLRASVHIRLPNLSLNYPKFEEISNMYGLQIRGTRGEHSESEHGLYDISNRRRLGLTEREAIFEMRDGILELIKQEKFLEKR